MDITTFTIEQLKALAFDEIIKKDAAQNNLNIIQVELQRRATIPPASPAPKKGK